MNNLINIGETAVNKTIKKGASECEVFLNSGKELKVIIENNEIKTAKSQQVDGIGIRVYKNKSLGFSSVNSFDENKINTAMENAVSLANVSIRDEYNELPEPTEINYVKGLYDKSVEGFSLEDAVKFAGKMLEIAKNYDKRITVAGGEFQTGAFKQAVVNSKGIKAEEQGSAFVYYILGMAVDGNEVSCMNFDVDGFVNLSEVNVEKVAKEFARRTIETLGAKKGESFKGTIILSPEEFNLLGGTIISAVNSNNVQKKMSRFSGKIGAKIASDIFSLEENTLRENKLSSGSFDREGVGKKPTKIIENGVLNTYLYNTYTAKKENKKSTGHASGMYRGLPSIMPGNIIVKSGKETKNELIKGVKKGILVSRFAGFPNTVTGDFSGVVKGGFLIEDGKLTRPVIETMIAGNAFELLMKISGVSKETKEVFGSSIPFIRIDDVSITSG